MISLVAFLGNYGKQYEKTRHNAGWLFADSVRLMQKCSWQKKFNGQYAVLERPVITTEAQRLCDSVRERNDLPQKVFFLKPETFMNLSGESIGALASFFKIKPEEILVVHDELELAPGFVSLKWSGGLGGHNGLRSSKSVLGTADFWRLRIGIGRPDHSDISGYVLSAFSADEQIILSQVFPQLEQLFMHILTDSPDTYLKEWSKKKVNA